jgi:cytoskeletal protein RodZ
MMTQNNDILNGIMGAPVTSRGDDELVPQMRVVTIRYKVYAAIIVVLLVFFFMEWLPKMQSTFTATHSVYDQTQATLQQLVKDKAEAQRDKTYLEEIEATQSTLETCLNEEEATACASLPETWNITYKGKTIKDFSVPLAYLQLNSLYNPKMPVDEKKVLRNLNEYLIRDGIHT